MAGITISLHSDSVLAAIHYVTDRMDDPEPMLGEIGEYLLISHDARWSQQISPDGTPWTPLSPRYMRRKDKERPGKGILEYDGFLRQTLRYQVNGAELIFGTDRPYGAVQQFGGQISIASRSQQAYFHATKEEVHPQFVRKNKSNFAQWVTLPAYQINMPARPWLGTSDEDDREILAIARSWLVRIVTGAGVDAQDGGDEAS